MKPVLQSYYCGDTKGLFVGRVNTIQPASAGMFSSTLSALTTAIECPMVQLWRFKREEAVSGLGAKGLFLWDWTPPNAAKRLLF